MRDLSFDSSRQPKPERVVMIEQCPRYPTPHQATRIAAFVIAARMEAERVAR